MSKTLGNVIDPFQLIEKYGVDALRYYFLAQFSPFNDGDFSEEQFKKTYNADLANGLGNLVARVSTLISKTPLPFHIKPDTFKELITSNEYSPYSVEIEKFEFNFALATLWSKIKVLDKKINQAEPWKLPEKERATFLMSAAGDIANIAVLLQPFLPETAEKILTQFSGEKIVAQPPLFPRLA